MALRAERAGPRLTLTLDRPAVHNALDEALMADLTTAVASAGEDAAVRVVVLAGEGASFCAGADLGWMRGIVGAPAEEQRRDAARLADLLDTIVRCPKPVVARVHGAALGGGVGLVAACDLAVAHPGAVFGLTEVRLGLAPAMIFPYLLRRARRDLLLAAALTGERFPAAHAHAMGLVQEVADDLDAVLARWEASLLLAGPAAIASVKALFRTVPVLAPDDARRFTVDLIAALRLSPEGQEGMRAFLEKRRPDWQA